MLAQYIDLILSLLPYVLTFFAGAATMFALVCQFIYRDETQSVQRAKHRASPKMETGADLEHIEQALAVANS